MSNDNVILAKEIAAKYSVSLLLAKILLLRGVRTLDGADSWLNWEKSREHDPFTMKNMDAAIEWAIYAKESGESVWIYGDYDLDGISGTAILSGALEDWGLKTSWMLPNRFNGGYGLSVNTLKKMKDAGARHLILIDTGISAVEEIKAAKEFGIRVLVLDHHKPSGEGLPNADVILDQFIEGCDYPNTALCGAGVAYKFLSALYKKTGKAAEDLEKYLPLVALGTLADIVPLTPENRFLVRSGMQKFATSNLLAIQELYKKLGNGKLVVGGNEIHYRMAPLLNAPGRMESPDLALNFLLCRDEQQIGALFEKLSACNAARRSTELEIHEKAVRRLHEIYGDDLPDVLIVDSQGWNIGVVGIVASRVAQEYKRPTAILSVTEDGVATASARSFGSFDWHSALQPLANLFVRWGGHTKAAGFNILAEKIPELRTRIEEQAHLQNFVPNKDEKSPYDLEVSLSELNLNFLDELQKLEPFGNECSYPIFLARAVKVKNLRTVNGGHLRFYAVQGYASISAVAFNKGYLEAEFHKRGDMVDLIFEVRRNVYQGTESLQLNVSGIL